MTPSVDICWMLCGCQNKIGFLSQYVCSCSVSTSLLSFFNFIEFVYSSVNSLILMWKNCRSPSNLIEYNKWFTRAHLLNALMHSLLSSQCNIITLNLPRIICSACFLDKVCNAGFGMFYTIQCICHAVIYWA